LDILVNDPDVYVSNLAKKILAEKNSLL